MDINNFEEMYGNKGGVKILKEFMDNGFTTNFIGEHFGVSAERVKQWCVEMFGKRYDPRQQRREYRIERMLEYAKTVSEEEFRNAYIYTDKYYHDLALSEAYVRGIYKND